MSTALAANAPHPHCTRVDTGYVSEGYECTLVVFVAGEGTVKERTEQRLRVAKKWRVRAEGSGVAYVVRTVMDKTRWAAWSKEYV